MVNMPLVANPIRPTAVGEFFGGRFVGDALLL
jgi:hypothetical protein